MTADRAKNKTLNSLRAIAALSVVSNHVLGAFTPVVDLGLLGVILFFLISGYVIVWSLEGLGARPVRNFLIRRVFRLYPAYWVAVLVATLLSVERISSAQLVANLTMFQEAMRIRDIDGVYWTLFIEWIFYGIIAVLLVCGVARKDRTYEAGLVLFTVGACGAALVWRVTGLHIPFGHMLFMSVFALGGMTSMWHRRGTHMKWIWPVAAVYLVFVFAVSELIYGPGGVNTAYPPLHFFADHAVPVALFLVALSRAWFAWRWLAYLGDLSYCIYLFHSPIQARLIPVIGNRVVLLAVVLAITIAVAVAVRMVVELPFIKIGRRLSSQPKQVPLLQTAV